MQPKESDRDIAEYIRRLTFNALIGNADMHLKNWSLRYPDRRNAQLAPAYDFVATVAYIKDETAALKFSRTKRFDQFSYDELAHLANRATFPRGSCWRRRRKPWNCSTSIGNRKRRICLSGAEVVKAIEAHVRKVPLT